MTTLKKAWCGKYLEVIEAEANNLKKVNVKIPLGCLVVVTGVSGSSTKYLNILFTEIKEISNGEVIPTDKEYTVVFLDADGNELSSQKVKEGLSAKAPNAPEIEGYEFKGWDTDFLKVTSDLVIKPIYEEKQIRIHQKIILRKQ